MYDVSEYKNWLFVVQGTFLKSLICNGRPIQKGNECIHREFICLCSTVNAKYAVFCSKQATIWKGHPNQSAAKFDKLSPGWVLLTVNGRTVHEIFNGVCFYCIELNN